MVTIVLALASLAATGSRLSLVLALAWACWYLFRRSVLAPRVKVAVAVVTGAAVVAAGLVFNASEILSSLSMSTVELRPQLYRMAAKAVAARPIVGWGPDGFFAGGMAISTPADASAGRIVALMPAGFDPHSLLLLIAASTGIVGLGVFGWFGAEVVARWRTPAPRGV